MNDISKERLAQVHPELARRIMQLNDALDFDMEVTQGYRTFAQQDALYNQGRTEPGIVVTDAPGGYSAHNFGYACDIVPEDIEPGQPDWNIDHAAWRAILDKATGFGLAEGARWIDKHDNPHMYLEELPAEPTDAMRQQFKEGQLPEVWKNFPTLEP